MRDKPIAFVDCGGHDGRSVRKFLESGTPYDKIYSFEPNPAFAECYDELPVEFSSSVVWIHDGFVDFYLGTDGHMQGSSVYGHKSTGELSACPIRILCIDLSRWIERLNRTHSIILKMDVEGAEYPILRKMLKDNTLSCVSSLLVEFHWNKIGISEEEHLDLLNKLEKVGLWNFSANPA